MVDTLKQQRDNIRQQLRLQRKSLSADALKTAGDALLKNCKSFLDNTKTVAGYNAMQGEMPLDAVFNYCHQNNITTLLPIMKNESLMFAPFDANTRFKTMQYGIVEPDVEEHALWKPEQLELVLVPLVAFDKSCHRIGMGGGFYDRSFEFRKSGSSKPTLVGVAHELQMVDDVFAQSWDVPLDFIATDTSLIERE